MTNEKLEFGWLIYIEREHREESQAVGLRVVLTDNCRLPTVTYREVTG